MRVTEPAQHAVTQAKREAGRLGHDRGAAIELRRHGASDLEIAQAGGWHLDQVRRFAKAARIPDIWDDPDAGRLGL
jgi:hypothetical protein